MSSSASVAANAGGVGVVKPTHIVLGSNLAPRWNGGGKAPPLPPPRSADRSGGSGGNDSGSGIAPSHSRHLTYHQIGATAGGGSNANGMMPSTRQRGSAVTASPVHSRSTSVATVKNSSPHTRNMSAHAGPFGASNILRSRLSAAGNGRPRKSAPPVPRQVGRGLIATPVVAKFVSSPPQSPGQPPSNGALSHPPTFATNGISASAPSSPLMQPKFESAPASPVMLPNGGGGKRDSGSSGGLRVRVSLAGMTPRSRRESGGPVSSSGNANGTTIPMPVRPRPRSAASSPTAKESRSPFNGQLRTPLSPPQRPASPRPRHRSAAAPTSPRNYPRTAHLTQGVAAASPKAVHHSRSQPGSPALMPRTTPFSALKQNLMERNKRSSAPVSRRSAAHAGSPRTSVSVNNRGGTSAGSPRSSPPLHNRGASNFGSPAMKGASTFSMPMPPAGKNTLEATVVNPESTEFGSPMSVGSAGSGGGGGGGGGDMSTFMLTPPTDYGSSAAQSNNLGFAQKQRISASCPSSPKASQRHQRSGLAQMLASSRVQQQLATASSSSGGGGGAGGASLLPQQLPQQQQQQETPPQGRVIGSRSYTPQPPSRPRGTPPAAPRTRGATALGVPTTNGGGIVGSAPTAGASHLLGAPDNVNGGPGIWMCHVCHYENATSVNSCEICSTEKRGSTRVVPVRVSVSVAAPSSSSAFGGGKQETFIVQAGNVTVPKTDLNPKRWKELEEIAESMRSGWNRIAIKDRRNKLKTHKKCFIGRDAIVWHGYNSKMNKEEATALMQELYVYQLIHHVTNSQPFRGDGEFFYRFQRDEEHTSLNMERIYIGETPDARSVADEIQSALATVYDKFVSEGGRLVDYEGIAGSAGWKAYLVCIEKLQVIDIRSLDYEGRTALWINLYNALFVHYRVKKVLQSKGTNNLANKLEKRTTNPISSRLKNISKASNGAAGTSSSLVSRMLDSDRARYNIGGTEYSLNNIKHDVLGLSCRCLGERGMKALRMYSSNAEVRKLYGTGSPDPRIHFAMTLGVKHSPVLRLFSSKNIDIELNDAATHFFSKDVEVDMLESTITISKLIDWYSSDFGETSVQIVSWIRDFIPEGAVKESATHLMTKDAISPLKIKYRTFDWGSNAKPNIRRISLGLN